MCALRPMLISCAGMLSTLCGSSRTFWRGLHPIISLIICTIVLASGATLTLAAEDTAPPAPKRIQLFGTVEFKGHFKTLTQWVNAMEEHKNNPIFTQDSKLNATTTWGTWKKELEKLSPLEQAKAVNTFWNKWPYRLDRAVYHKEDFWAAPYLFRKNSGDCEDYCIAKYFTLRELGFTADQLRIVVVIEKIRNIAHAILAVYINDDAYILDNLSPNVLSHTKSRNYAAQYSVNEEFRWAHVLPKKP